MKSIYEFKSTGKEYQCKENEFDFFKFLVYQKFGESGKVLQWCSFSGLKMTFTTSSEDVLAWAENIIKNGFTTMTGYNYELIN